MGIELHHTPVMTPEVLQALSVQPGGRYIDATLGEGGHSTSILSAADPGGQVLGLDADPEAVSVATERLADAGETFLALNVNFRDIRATALRYEFVPVHGVLFDLGVSSLQLDREARGFSFRRADPLDMRFDFDQQLTAADIVNDYAESELADVIFHLGEDRAARRIARAIVRNRPITTSLELADLIEKVNPRRGSHIHPATRTFQAIRIAVNDELSALETALEQAVSLLGQGGR
ncbi:MAG: 16S rRNA (cytosine(1402)-N(4))-methyltransferase RsmH, partial [SAR202 cluster bacterium]|nr:16S rRNA (cytosine(1402)-N(4))-methyltransferase RsmH [SAR202 cluster bacterium]